MVLAALAVASSVGGMALLGALTGASMNPARGYGPAVASGVWHAHGIYGVLGASEIRRARGRAGHSAGSFERPTLALLQTRASFVDGLLASVD